MVTESGSASILVHKARSLSERTPATAGRANAAARATTPPPRPRTVRPAAVATGRRPSPARRSPLPCRVRSLVTPHGRPASPNPSSATPARGRRVSNSARMSMTAAASVRLLPGEHATVASVPHRRVRIRALTATVATPQEEHTHQQRGSGSARAAGSAVAQVGPGDDVDAVLHAQLPRSRQHERRLDRVDRWHHAARRARGRHSGSRPCRSVPRRCGHVSWRRLHGVRLVCPSARRRISVR